MREIKFRFFRTNKKEMVYGFKGCSLGYVLSMWENERNVSSPMQYTGISQGKLEFYEGDILRFSVFGNNGRDYTESGEIVWECDGWAIKCKNGYVFSLGVIKINDDSVEIIGNIHEGVKND